MKIDSHQHFWKYDPVRDSWINTSMKVIQRDFLPSHLLPILEYNDIDACVAVQADQSLEETEFLLHLANENDFIKGVVGWVDLCDPSVEDHLGHFLKNPYLKGVRHIVQAEKEDFVLSEDFQKGIESLAKFGLTYDILVFPNQLKNINLLVKKFPKQKFVLDHIAKPFIKKREINEWAKDIQLLAKNKNVCCKVSGMLTEADWSNWKKEDLKPYLDIIFEAFGTKRLMFGSDWPVCLLASTYNEALEIVQEYIAQFSEEEQKLIMGNNASSFYNL